MAQQLVNAIALGAVYTLFALGLTLSWGILGVLNLAHGAIFMAGALGAWVLTSWVEGLPLWVVLPCAAALAAALAVALEALAFGPIRRRSQTALDAEFRTLVASIAAASIIVALAEVISDDQPFTLPPSLLEVTGGPVLGVQVTNIQVILLVVAVLLSAALIAFVRRTRHGRALRAVAFDRATAGLAGISAERLGRQAIALSGALAGVAGVLLAVYLGSAEARMGEPLLLKAFAIIILAGVGSLGGAVAFAFGLALVETMVGYWLGAELRDGLAFTLIVIVLLLRPQGFVRRGAWQRT